MEIDMNKFEEDLKKSPSMTKVQIKEAVERKKAQEAVRAKRKAAATERRA